MEAQGMPECYVYLDMQYEDTLPALNAMAENTLRLMIIGITAFLLVGLVAFYLMQNRMKDIVIGARRIGLSQKAIWNQTASMFALLSVFSAVLGSLLAMTTFVGVTKALLKVDIAIQIKPILICASVEMLFLMIASTLCCRTISNPNLMQSGRKQKGR